MAIRTRKRGLPSSKRMYRESLRALVLEGLVTTKLGEVKKFKGEDSHFEVDEGEILVDVEIQPDGERCFCRLGALMGGPSNGIWAIPDEGTEVVVAWPDMEFEADPWIVGVLSSGGAPNGLVPGKIVVIGTEIEVNSTGDVNVNADGDATISATEVFIKDSGLTEPVVKLSEFNAHTHLLPPLTVPITGAAGTTPVATGGVGSAGVTVVPAPLATGTAVLKAE